MIEYLCKACCKKLNITFCGDAVNEAGRKCCSECGNSDDWRLNIKDSETQTPAQKEPQS